MTTTTNDNKDRSMVPAPTFNEKPLNATQTKNLERIVEGDFKDVFDQVMLSLDRRRQDLFDEIDEEYRELEERAIQVKADLQAKANSFMETMAEYAEELKGEGFVFASVDEYRGAGGREVRKVNPVAVTVFSVGVDGKQEKREKTSSAITALKDTARTIIAREQRRSMRDVLLRGVTPSAAQELVADLPEAEDILTLVEAEMQATARTADLAVLIPKAKQAAGVESTTD